MEKAPKHNTRWTRSEKNEMVRLLSHYANPIKGFEAVGKLLNRSAGSVSWQYYSTMRKRATKKVPTSVPLEELKPAKSSVLYHEPETTVLEITERIKSIQLKDKKLIIELL